MSPEMSPEVAASYPGAVDLTRWPHRQLLFLVWLLAAGLLYVLSGLGYSLPFTCGFAVYELLLMRWVAKKRAAARP